MLQDSQNFEEIEHRYAEDMKDIDFTDDEFNAFHKIIQNNYQGLSLTERYHELMKVLLYTDWARKGYPNNHPALRYLSQNWALFTRAA